MRNLVAFLTFPLLLFAASATGCALMDAANRTVRSDSSGVELVVSSATDRPLTWKFERLHVLGGKEEGVEAFYRVWPNSVGADRQGNLYVLDASAHRVIVFGPGGKVLRTLGAMGGGPGEFRSAASLAVSSEGVTHIFDYAKHHLVRFGPQGDTLPEVDFSFYPWPNFQRHVGIVGTAYAVASDRSGSDGARAVGLRLLTATDTARLASVALPASKMVKYDRCGGGLNLPPIFWPELIWDTDGQRIAVNGQAGYVIDVVENGRTVRSIRRTIEPIAATRELAMQELGEGFRINFGAGPCTISPGEMVDGRGFAEAVSTIANIRVSPEGELWVQRKRVGIDASGPIDIFDATGAYLGTLPEGSRMPLVLLPGGRAALALKDEADVERIEVVQVRRN